MKTALYDLHKELGATFTNFMGYEMPVKYRGIQEEHLNVRHNIGIFDVSHMGNLFVRGDAEKISYFITGNASKINEGMGEYTMLLDEYGYIIDDEVYFKVGKDEYLFIPNSGMHGSIYNWMRINDGLELKDMSDEYSILAIQGPKVDMAVMEVLEKDVLPEKFFEIRNIPEGKFKIKTDISKAFISRSGYTGEKGYEMYIYPAEAAVEIFRAFLEKGEKYGIMPVGLGARDSLRLEKAFMLAGNEFRGGRTPFEVNLDFFIDWEHDFIGKEALKKKKDSIGEKIAPLEVIDRGIPRHGDAVYSGEEKIGIVSSGGYSPCLKKGIALAFIKNGYRKEGNEVKIVGQREMKAKIVKCPFVKKGEC
ncbi:MAG: glycine cleavage system aminomethyltransferase GcvT [Thermoplasmata archaeon]|nr:glycine cleavage system aminomethyltransferase GcvT [Thermoplasmata archaeon]